MMAHWDYKSGKIVYWPSQPIDGYPGWVAIDCGCCAGVEWGGDSPEECRSCGGTGQIAQHNESRVLALYPGGPLCGRAVVEALQAAEGEEQ